MHAAAKAWAAALDELLAACRAAPHEPLVLLATAVTYLQVRTLVAVGRGGVFIFFGGRAGLSE